MCHIIDQRKNAPILKIAIVQKVKSIWTRMILYHEISRGCEKFVLNADFWAEEIGIGCCLFMLKTTS